MIAYKYKFTNKSGFTLTLNDHPVFPLENDNVYALQKYPTISKVVKNNEMERTGQNNYWDFDSYYGKLTFNFAGIIVAESHSKLEQMKAEMIKVFALPLQPTTINDGYVLMEWTDDDGISKQLEVKIINDLQFDRPLAKRYRLDFILQLKAKNNYIESAGGDLISFGSRTYLSQGGIILPTLVPISWNTQYADILNITLAGIFALPKIRIYGESQQVINNPTIKNLTTGESFTLNLTLANETSFIEIDTEKGTCITESGQDVSGYIDPNSQFINLTAGLNQLVYISDENPLISLIEPEKGNIYNYTETINTLIHQPLNGKSDGVAFSPVKTIDRFGRSNQAYKFDGITDYLSTGKSVVVDSANNDYTIMAWIKAQNNPNNSNPWSPNYQSVVMDDQGGYNWAWFGISIRQHEIISWLGGWGQTQGGFSADLYDGNWHHIAVSMPKSSGVAGMHKFYVDGIYVGSHTNVASLRPSPWVNTSNIGLGLTYGGYNSAFKGSIDLAIIENRLWTDAEILAEYTKQKDGIADPKFIVNYKEIYAN